MKILIIGRDGFIGSHLLSYFDKKGIPCIGISSRTLSINQIENNLSYNLFLDVLKSNTHVVVINCVGNGNVQTSVINPSLDFEANVGFTQQILEILRKNQTKCTYLHFSSAAVYGNPKILPIKEKDDLNPISPYGYHKLLSEQLCRQYASLYGLQCIVLRPFSVFGPKLRKQLVWDIHEKFFLDKNFDEIVFFGTGDETRDFIFIEDLCQVIDIIVSNLNNFSIFEVFNIANGEEISVKAVVDLIARRLNNGTYVFSGNKRAGDPINWKADITRITELGYRKEYSLEEALGIYTKWYLNNSSDR